MDVDDDDEYVNAAAAHAAFVMTVSAASNVYWLLRHAQHARDLNIHKLHPLPEKIGLSRSADFLHSGTGYIENSRVRSMIDFFADFSQNFSERKIQSRFQSRFQLRFSAQWNTPFNDICFYNDQVFNMCPLITWRVVNCLLD